MIEYNLPLKRTKYPNEMGMGSYKSGSFYYFGTKREDWGYIGLLVDEEPILCQW